MLATVDVQREARAAGIPRNIEVDLKAVERRRAQLWVVMSVVLSLVSTAAGAVALFPALSDDMLLSPRLLQLALPVISLGFVAYAFEKHRALGRVAGTVMADLARREQLSVHTSQLRAALIAGKDLAACADADAVGITLLSTAVDVFGASDGSLLLLRGGRLELAARQGHDRGAHLDDDTVELVADTGIPVHLDPYEGGRRNAMAVPVMTHETHHGVLVIAAPDGADYTDHDLSVLAAFAEYGAHAIDNALRLEAARAGTDRLRAMEDARSEFSWLRHETATT